MTSYKRLKELTVKVYGKEYGFPEELPVTKSKDDPFIKAFEKEFKCSLDAEDFKLWEFKRLGDFVDYVVCRCY